MVDASEGGAHQLLLSTPQAVMRATFRADQMRALVQAPSAKRQGMRRICFSSVQAFAPFRGSTGKILIDNKSLKFVPFGITPAPYAPRSGTSTDKDHPRLGTGGGYTKNEEWK